MAPAPLTDDFLCSVAPTDKPRRFFDGAGLYIEVSPTGCKSWRLKYRFAGLEKRLPLGTYPETGLEEARTKCDTARQLLKNGTDPGELAKVQRAKQAQERAARQAATRFSIYNDGALSVRFGNLRIVLTASETHELRTFLDATRAMTSKLETSCP